MISRNVKTLLLTLQILGTLLAWVVFSTGFTGADPLHYYRGSVLILLVMNSISSILLYCCSQKLASAVVFWIIKLISTGLVIYTWAVWEGPSLILGMLFFLEAGILITRPGNILFTAVGMVVIMYPPLNTSVLGLNRLATPGYGGYGNMTLFFFVYFMFTLLGIGAGHYLRKFHLLVQQNLQYETSLQRLSHFNLQLQAYAKNANEESAEKERQRISRELHDISGYIFTNVIALMDAAMSIGSKDYQKVHGILFTARKQAQEGLRETRIALRQLRQINPSRENGLDVIYQIVDIFKQVTGTKVELSFSNLPLSFDENLNRSLYRIVQESLTNAIRHGKATEVRLQFWIHEETLKITIHDNGLGAQEITKGIGLTGMEERMEELGGKIQAGNAPEGGFTLHLSVPLEQYGSTYRALGKREPLSDIQKESIGSNHVTDFKESNKVEIS